MSIVHDYHRSHQPPPSALSHSRRQHLLHSHQHNGLAVQQSTNGSTNSQLHSSPSDHQLARLKSHKVEFDRQLATLCRQLAQIVNDIEALRSLNDQLYRASVREVLKTSSTSEPQQQNSSSSSPSKRSSLKVLSKQKAIRRSDDDEEEVEEIKKEVIAESEPPEIHKASSSPQRVSSFRSVSSTESFTGSTTSSSTSTSTPISLSSNSSKMSFMTTNSGGGAIECPLPNSHQQECSSTSSSETMITEVDLDRLTLVDIDSLQMQQLNCFINMLYEAAVAGVSNNSHAHKEDNYLEDFERLYQEQCCSAGRGHLPNGQLSEEIEEEDEDDFEESSFVLSDTSTSTTTSASASFNSESSLPLSPDDGEPEPELLSGNAADRDDVVFIDDEEIAEAATAAAATDAETTMAYATAIEEGDSDDNDAEEDDEDEDPGALSSPSFYGNDESFVTADEDQESSEEDSDVSSLVDDVEVVTIADSCAASPDAAKKVEDEKVKKCSEVTTKDEQVTANSPTNSSSAVSSASSCSPSTEEGETEGEPATMIRKNSSAMTFHSTTSSITSASTPSSSTLASPSDGRPPLFSSLKKRSSSFNVHSSFSTSSPPKPKDEDEEEDEGIGGGGGCQQKAVEIKSYDETGREVFHRVVLRPVHRSTTISSGDDRPRPRVTIREQQSFPTPPASSTSSKSPDGLDIETMSFANRRNMWERRSLGRGYKFRAQEPPFA